MGLLDRNTVAVLIHASMHGLLWADYSYISTKSNLLECICMEAMCFPVNLACMHMRMHVQVCKVILGFFFFLIRLM